MNKKKILRNVKKLLSPGFQSESKYATDCSVLGKELGQEGFGVVTFPL